MRIKDDELLSEFRQKSHCEWCGAEGRGHLHPHHVQSRGMGGGSRLDVPENLIAVCYLCHARIHNGQIKRPTLLAVIAKRERKPAAKLVEVIYGLLQVDRSCAMNYAFHPASEIFPLMDDQEYEDLKEDIRKHGLREPIVVYEGMILDGRNRYKACKEVGIKPEFRKWKGESATSFVYSENFCRRHLDTGAKAISAAKFRKELEKEAEESRLANLKKGKNSGKSPNGPKGTFGETAEIAGKKFGVSRNSVKRASSVLSNGVPELEEAVCGNEVKVTDAAAIADKPPETQRRALAAKRAGKVRTLKQATEDEPCDANSSGQLVDQVDQAVPTGLVGVFKKVPSFRSIINWLNQVKREVHELREHPAGVELRPHVQRICSEADSIKDCVTYDTPYAVCPVCAGSPKSRKKDCPCASKGWMTKPSYGRLPQELRA